MAGTNGSDRAGKTTTPSRNVILEFYIRSGDLVVDEVELYRIGTPYFCLKVNHGGKFFGFPGRVYRGGKVDHVDLLDGELFNAHLLDKIVARLGYRSPVWYHYVIPGSDLDIGLMPLGCDLDVRNMTKYVYRHKVIDVYLEHGQTLVDTYSMSPHKQKILFEELPCDVLMLSPQHNRRRNVVTKRGSASARKLLPEFGECSSQNPFETEGDAQPDLNEENATTNTEDEVLHGTAGMETGESGSDNETESDDSDYEPAYDDPEHEIHEVQVDMKEFRCNVDFSVEWMPMGSNLGGETSNPVEGNIDELDFDAFNERSSSEDEVETHRRGKKKVKVKYPEFDREKDLRNPIFYVGQLFGSKKDIKDAVKIHSIQTRRQLKIIKNDKNRVRVLCKGTYPIEEEGEPQPDGQTEAQPKAQPAPPKAQADGQPKAQPAVKTEPCLWAIYFVRDPTSNSWQVKTYKSEHRCLQSRDIAACTANYLASQIEEEIKRNPEVPVSAIQAQMEQKLEVNVSSMKAFRAKVKAHNNLIGDYTKQYDRLRDYALELQKSNPGTTVKIEIEPCPNAADTNRTFKRIYVCLGPLKEGYKASGRELLGLDGAFMKGPFPGQLFSAVAVDSNNGIYPIAYAMVEAETMSSWTWFLQCLADDLDLYANSNYTFISDRQKGLIPALAKVLPQAEHRFCLQHIYQNFKRDGYKGKWYKDAVWRAACATTIQDFDIVMEELKKQDVKAYDWLRKIKADHWTRSHFSGRAKCDTLYNNMCESFNKQLKPARDKPIITCLEFVREYLMKHIVVVQKEIGKCHGILCPAITKIFDGIIKQASSYRAVWNGSDKYQVKGPNTEHFVVDLVRRTCSCRKWELTSMPCKHAVAAIWVHGENGGNGIPEHWVDAVYKLATWKKMYSFKLNPINGPRMWPKSECPTTLKPPLFRPPPGRPKKARRKSADEIEEEKEKANDRAVPSVVVGPKMSRSTVVLKCTKCGNPGHNARTCKGQGGSTQNQEPSRAKLPVKRKARQLASDGVQVPGDVGTQTSRAGDTGSKKTKGKSAGPNKSHEERAQYSETTAMGSAAQGVGTNAQNGGSASSIPAAVDTASVSSVVKMKGLLFSTRPRT